MYLKSENNVLNERYNKVALIKKGVGPYIYLGNKKYFDLSYGSGTLILGHNSKHLKKSLSKLNRNDISLYSEPNIHASQFAKTLKKINSNYDKFVFCNSGTEAVFKALRITKAISRKNIIISVTGSWHGSADRLLFQKKKGQILPMSDGLNESDRKNIKIIDYNDIDKSKKILNKFKNKIACIIIEPIQGCLPDPKIKKYLEFLSNFSKKNKFILIYDEIITGLRTKKGSVQNFYNLKPDISLFGKCYGGGFPIGIIAVTKKIHKLIYKKKLNIFFGGTFSANAFASFIGNSTTNHIYKNKKIIKKLENFSIQFQKKINSFLINEKIDAQVYRFQTMLRIVFSKKSIKDRISRDFFEKKNIKKIDNFKLYLMKKGIIYPNNGIIFFSDANTIQNLNYIIKNISIGLKKFFK